MTLAFWGNKKQSLTISMHYMIAFAKKPLLCYRRPSDKALFFFIQFSLCFCQADTDHGRTETSR